MNCPQTIHLVIITEANISDRTKSLFELVNYEMNTQLRDSRKGRGVIVYVHKSICFTRLFSSTQNFECITGELTTEYGSTFGLCAVYRPPDTNRTQFIEELRNQINKILPLNNVVLLGDINIDLKRKTSITKRYLNTLCELGFESGINQFTRIDKRGSLSSMIATDKGTAQGSILGPTEYLLYVNDMCNIFTEGSVYQFADDTCLVAAHRDIREAQRVIQCNFDLLKRAVVTEW
ncbi:hypothetical protein PYW08_010465 [Mythimna loreyi]|uniref:Uncharacterized protein n=1 Tax=Mythimna loreyi TaxID=667449 RepID=A0ACC2Q5F8_9NEOP|nr:hypothetical protein PYW08_010465 [Mythimna loreyi]